MDERDSFVGFGHRIENRIKTTREVEMDEIKNKLHELPKALNEYHEGELTAIGLAIMNIALTKLNGRLRERVCKIAFMLCDLEEDLIGEKK